MPLAEALALAREQNNRSLSVSCFHMLSGAHLQLGGLTKAREYAEEGVKVARSIGSPKDVSFALYALGAVCRFEGHFDDAAAAYEEAKLLIPHGDLGEEHVHNRSLACVAIAQGCLVYARKLLIECIRLTRQYDPHFRNYRDLEVATLLAAAYGDWARA